MNWWRRPLSYFCQVCLGDKLPVWATLLGIVIGAVVTATSTFWIVPRLNESLERQKIRTEFIIRNLDDINARTRALVSEISELHLTVLQNNVVDPLMIKRILPKITEMQWKAIELGIIFEGADGAKVVQSYQSSLDNVRVALTNLKTKNDLVASQRAIEAFSSSTLDVVRQLANLGGLRVSPMIVIPKT